MALRLVFVAILIIALVAVPAVAASAPGDYFQLATNSSRTLVLSIPLRLPIEWQFKRIGDGHFLVATVRF